MFNLIKSWVTRILTRVFGTKHDRDLRVLWPQVSAINAEYEKLSGLSDEALRAKTDEFRARLAAGETLDDLLSEAFAVVKEACRRHVGQSWALVGHEVRWEMVPFDVQLIGAIALHGGKITEMATGEGKTLVAVMPLYLNALAGKGCHLITVNDYLARRDSEWMGQILRFLGLSVGVIQHDMDPPSRRAAYGCDVTYGTNNEFGFDYLRDNMAVRKEDQVQRPHFYAIVDEVDSVLVDEARTPLIISGPVAASDQRYDSLRDPVDRLVRAQSRRVNEIVGQAEELLRESREAAERGESKAAGEKEYEAGVRLLQVRRGAPKHKRFMKLVSEGSLKPLIQRVEGDFMRDKRLHTVDDDLYYSIDEREHSINLSDDGRAQLSPGDPDYFVLPDLAEMLGAADDDEDLSPKERAARKQEVHLAYARKADELHTIHQLLRAFCLYDRDVEYVVQDAKVMIVDEFTGRLMPGRRFSEGLHQALEAKEQVRVEGETQTWATITLQNYFRLYEKLAGMTGTAETEAAELWEIYKLDVVVIPSNEPLRRIDYNDQIFRTRREKYNAIIEEIAFVHAQGRPVLVGTVTVEVSETLSRMLKRRGINHAVLNAKYHQQEADVVAQAGRPGAVTIATNMAGRGTDIKLGAGIVKGRKCLIASSDEVGDCDAVDHPTACIAEMPCGLHIVGTERHESRRIDRQLRGRSGRQGDPGSSRFFMSLEDDLMRLFGSDRISALMERMGAVEGEVIQHDFVTKAIERAQKRVEAHNFEIRKHLLEYDNVMNQQREVIYGIRNQILAGRNLAEEMRGLIAETIDARLEPVAELWRGRPPDLDEVGSVLQEAGEELERIFLAPFPLLDWARGTVQSPDADEGAAAGLREAAEAVAQEAYQAREVEWGQEIAREIERRVYLRVIDDHWKDHLYELDLVRGGVGLRAYGQKDPLLEYKAEAFRLFETLMGRISEETLQMLMRVQVQREGAPPPQAAQPSGGTMQHAAAGAFAGGQRAAASPSAGEGGGDIAHVGRRPAAPKPVQTVVRRDRKVGRNEPCPCGSGKKYKKCCGQGA